MTAEQLQAAQAAHWRQNQNPILTLEDATSWFSQHPLCLFLPRRAQLPAPAPSFVEACLGAANATPPYTAVEQANGLLARLMASDSVLALNLLGVPGEQPDFLAHREVLPFLVSLRGERDWKHAPGSSAIHKVSPLVVELWKTLEQAGPLTAGGIREKLGRELTESAVLRALSELWQSLRVIPVLQPEGQPATWELLEARHGDAVAKGNGTSQVTAISLLVSMYLQSVYAASGDEIEIFLSPLVSRSRIREAVRGLSATRQIHSLSMETRTYYFLEDGLPKSAETELERPKAITPRRPRVAEPKRVRAGVPEWAKVAKPKQAPESAAPGAAAKHVPRPDRAAPSPSRSGPPLRRTAGEPRRFAAGPAAGQGSSRPRPDKGDYPRRKDSRPAFGKRPSNDQGRPRTKERWRNTPGKPGYQPDRARPQGAAPPTRPGGPPAGGRFSRPARPFSPGGERRGPPLAGHSERPRGGENSAPRRGTPTGKFPGRKFREHGAGTQGFERPQRRPAAGGTFAPRGQGVPRTERPRPTGPAYGRAEGSRFRTGKPASGKPELNKLGPDKARPSKTGSGWPRAGSTGRHPSAWGDKAGGGERSPGTRRSFGARSGPSAGGGSFSRQGSGFGSAHAPAGEDGRKSFRTRPGGSTPGGRAAGGKHNFSGKGRKSKESGGKNPGNKGLGSKDMGRNRPEA